MLWLDAAWREACNGFSLSDQHLSCWLDLIAARNSSRWLFHAISRRRFYLRGHLDSEKQAIQLGRRGSDGAELKAHRAVLGIASPVFRCMLRLEMEDLSAHFEG